MLIAVSSFGKGLRRVFLTDQRRPFFAFRNRIFRGFTACNNSSLQFFVFSALCLVLCNRQDHREGSPLSYDRVHPDASLVIVDDGFDNR
jgi:hypothetical protein